MRQYNTIQYKTILITMDHYKVLGLGKNATKDEIKEAFRRLAVKYHPDKHSQSSEAVRNNATLRFRQISEAYQILSDDRKRADYNIRSSSSSFNRRKSSGHRYYRDKNYYSSGNYYNRSNGSTSFVSNLERALGYLTTRAFLLNVVFAGALVGGMVVIDKSQEALWKIHNSGKSFEEAIESVEKSKADRNTQKRY